MEFRVTHPYNQSGFKTVWILTGLYVSLINQYWLNNLYFIMVLVVREGGK